MTTMLDETHDAGLRSWVASANDGATDFPIQNLPFGVFRLRGTDEPFRGGVAIGDRVLDLAAARAAGAFDAADALAQAAAEAASQSSLNALMALGPDAWHALRLALSRVLREGAPQRAMLEDALHAQADAEYTLPATVGDYTDFYTSVHHATAVGALFRPDNPLLPNYKWVPIGYHGRSSTLGVSGQTFVRPKGQLKGPNDETPRLAPCARLDYELELGVFVGPSNAAGEGIALQEAEAHVFGVVLLNDWSARDVQAWEYQPLGPFLAKNFATTLSPWVVTLDALAPYRTAFTRPADDPQPLPYLDHGPAATQAAFDIELETWLETPRMREAGAGPALLARSNFRHAYWTVAQMVTHHAVNGCALRPGDLMGTGTQSGPDAAEAGSLLELTRGGKQALTLPSGESRTFLEDGDAVILRGRARRDGFASLGFGDCRGQVLPAR